MAIQRNNMTNVPLNGGLNFSKLKTDVKPFIGFNDLNAPIYGDTISPFYMAERKTQAPGNNRPYIDERNILRDKNGKQLLDVNGFKGLKRKELKVPSRALAVFDETHYVDVNEDYEYTVIQAGEKFKTLNYEAVAAIYSEKKVGIVFVLEKGTLHVFDANTLEELASAPALDSIKASINTFYDPYSDWQVVSMYEPFGEWIYHKNVKATLENPEWTSWNAELTKKKNAYDDAKNKVKPSKKAYDDLKDQRDTLQQDVITKRGIAKVASDVYAWVFAAWFYGGQSINTQEYQAVIEAQAESEKANEAVEKAEAALADWDNKFKKDLEAKEKAYKDNKQTADAKENEYLSWKAKEPQKYIQDPKNPDYSRGFVGRTYNFFFDKATKKLVEKKINIPFGSLSKGCFGPTGDSYIFTGIYDTGLKQSGGKWQSNTDTDFIRYRLGVVPHEIKMATGGGDNRYYFTLNYSPKILFRKRDINAALNVGTNISSETKTWLSNKKDGQTSYEFDAFFSGTGINGRTPVWCRVVYGKNEKVNFNDYSLFHDFGEAKYDFYSPRSSNGLKNCMETPTDSTESIVKTPPIKTYFNYDVCSNNIFYEKPITNGEVLKEHKPTNIFREVVSNGVINNLSIAEDNTKMGTFLETPNSINPNIPIFYRDGKDGSAVVFKTLQNKWISIEVVDKVDEIYVLNEEFAILYTANSANCIRLSDGKIKHFAPDWNNRFSLSGSPYLYPISPFPFPKDSNDQIGSDLVIGSGINLNFEISQDQITGYASNINRILSNRDNITPVGFVSKWDSIDYYYGEVLKEKKYIPPYYITIEPSGLNYGIYNNVDLGNVLYPSSITNVPGLFCKIKPSNFGRFYLDDGSVFYSLVMYNGKIYYAYFTSTLLDDVKELFMVQGQTFAITKSDYIYSVFLDQRGTASLTDAIVNVKGLKYCGSVPEMAIFYSPMDRTLKSFTADHILKNIQQATSIGNVYYTTYNPQTSSVYIATDNGLYVYAINSQYRLPILGITDITFDEKHTFITFTNKDRESITRDYLFDSEKGLDAADYVVQPVRLETKYYGLGNNTVSNTDCVYFRLFSNDGPKDTYLNIKENTLTDAVYQSAEKKLEIHKKDWDERTNTCYIRYQPKYQKNVGISITLETTCSISEIVFSTGPAETVAISKNALNM